MRHGDRESLSAMAKAVTCSAMSHDVMGFDRCHVMGCMSMLGVVVTTRLMWHDKERRRKASNNNAQWHHRT